MFTKVFWKADLPKGKEENGQKEPHTVSEQREMKKWVKSG